MLKRIFYILLIIFLLLQLIPRPDKNAAGAQVHAAFQKAYNVPDNIDTLLKAACYDCHSDNTEYPWYAAIQPVAWWMGKHIEDGKRHLNFSAFETYSLRKQYHKLEEVEELVSNGEMPLSSYTIIHRNAVLNTEQVNNIVKWSRDLRSAMEARYPADSLKAPKK